MNFSCCVFDTGFKYFQEFSISQSSLTQSHICRRGLFLCPPAASPTPTSLAPPLCLLHGGGQGEGFSTAPVRACKLPLQRERNPLTFPCTEGVGVGCVVGIGVGWWVVVLGQCLSACGQLLLHPSPSGLLWLQIIAALLWQSTKTTVTVEIWTGSAKSLCACRLGWKLKRDASSWGQQPIFVLLMSYYGQSKIKHWTYRGWERRGVCGHECVWLTPGVLVDLEYEREKSTKKI